MSSNRLNEETALDKNACIRFGEGVLKVTVGVHGAALLQGQ